ncbi:MAG: hypothetical protein ACXABY_04320 [Candidatus Thorarchaeota archaeon]|jgi:hypothetical protein
MKLKCWAFHSASVLSDYCLALEKPKMDTINMPCVPVNMIVADNLCGPDFERRMGFKLKDWECVRVEVKVKKVGKKKEMKR